MPSKRKDTKRLYGGYLEQTDINRLDREAKKRGFETRTRFLFWIAKISASLPMPSDDLTQPEK